MNALTNSCPWSNWQPAVMHFCEGHLCSWISAPSETFSNIGYIFLGFYLCWLAYKKKQSTFYYLFGYSAWVMGIFSAFYHASHSLVFELLDQSAMLMLSSVIVIGAMIRLGHIKKKWMGVTYLWLLCAAVATLFLTPGPYRINIFSAMIILAIIMEIVLHRRNEEKGGREEFRWIWATIAIFSLSYGFWLLDLHHVMCNPDNHIMTGHAAWHLINSICFWTLYRHYLQYQGKQIP